MNRIGFHFLFYVMLGTLIYTIYYKFWKGIITSSILLIMIIVLWIYSYKRHDKRERFR